MKRVRIGKDELLRINRWFGGTLRYEGSIDFAIEKMRSKKLGPYKKLAFLWRSILVDHPFSDGNKRTAVFVAHVWADWQGRQLNEELIIRHAIDIAKKNITDIRQIERRLKDAIQ